MVNPKRTDKITEADLSNFPDSKQKCIISVEEYRRVMSDAQSSDKQVIQRIRYLEALLRNIIKQSFYFFV